MKIGKPLRKWNIKMIVVGQEELVIGQLWQMPDFFMFTPKTKLWKWARPEVRENEDGKIMRAGKLNAAAKEVLEAVKDRYRGRMRREEGEEGDIKFTMSAEEICF